MFDPVQSLPLVQHPHGGPKSLWTPERVAQLKELVAKALSASAIGALMGVTRNSISGKCDRLGLRLLGTTTGRPPTAGLVYKEIRKRRRNYAAETVRRTSVVRRKLPDFVYRDTAAVEPLRISISDLENFHCKAVMDETDDNCCRVYCGHPVVYRSFCAAHAKVNFVWGRR